ncbi:hypothetical protein HBB16_07040 [Pseudonocardia sp. MCCB 268]|nr:hypothetical protein [Pseudonocardia cytotoxica]
MPTESLLPAVPDSLRARIPGAAVPGAGGGGVAAGAGGGVGGAGLQPRPGAGR